MSLEDNTKQVQDKLGFRVELSSVTEKTYRIIHVDKDGKGVHTRPCGQAMMDLWNLAVDQNKLLRHRDEAAQERSVQVETDERGNLVVKGRG